MAGKYYGHKDKQTTGGFTVVSLLVMNKLNAKKYIIHIQHGSFIKTLGISKNFTDSVKLLNHEYHNSCK